jgi:hypothetical protein
MQASRPTGVEFFANGGVTSKKKSLWEAGERSKAQRRLENFSNGAKSDVRKTGQRKIRRFPDNETTGGELEYARVCHLETGFLAGYWRILGRLFAKRPERLRVALWWLLAAILALSCAWVNGGWRFPPRESQHWIGYAPLFAALLRSIRFLAAQLVSALASATLGIAATLLPIAQNGWMPLVFGCWFLASLLSYLLVRLVLHQDFETASLRAPLLLTLPLLVSAVMLFFAGSAKLAELAVAGGIAVGGAYLAQHFSALGRGFVEVTLLSHFLLLLNGTAYADLPPWLGSSGLSPLSSFLRVGRCACGEG